MTEELSFIKICGGDDAVLDVLVSLCLHQFFAIGRTANLDEQLATRSHRKCVQDPLLFKRR